LCVKVFTLTDELWDNYVILMGDYVILTIVKLCDDYVILMGKCVMSKFMDISRFIYIYARDFKVYVFMDI